MTHTNENMPTEEKDRCPIDSYTPWLKAAILPPLKESKRHHHTEAIKDSSLLQVQYSRSRRALPRGPSRCRRGSPGGPPRQRSSLPSLLERAVGVTQHLLSGKTNKNTKKKDRYKFSYTHMTKNTEQVVAPAPFRSGRPPKRKEEGQAYSVVVW